MQLTSAATENQAHDQDRSGPRSRPVTGTAGARQSVPVADGLRGWSMMIVVVHHCFICVPDYLHQPHETPAFVLGAYLAVPFFFLLSGFLLFLPLARGGELEVRGYVVRRVGRIVPAYYVMLAGLLLLWPFVFEVPSPMASTDGVGALLAHLTFVHQIVLGAVPQGFLWDRGFGVNGPVWTLTAEVVLYVALPLVANRFRRSPVTTLAAALAITLGWRILTVNLRFFAGLVGLAAPSWLGTHAYQQAPNYFFAFGVGMMTASLFVRYQGEPWFRTRNAVLAHAGCAVALLCLIGVAGRHMRSEDAYHLYVRDFLPTLALGGVLLFAGLGPARAQFPYANGVSRLLGDVSYGAYIWHMILLQIFVRSIGLGEHSDAGEALTTVVALVVPSALIVGYVSHRFIERPVIRFVRERQARARATTQTT
jgi:peptidoglycan/LPS O-acetylase OafA/YrhL